MLLHYPPPAVALAALLFEYDVFLYVRALLHRQHIAEYRLADQTKSCAFIKVKAASEENASCAVHCRQGPQAAAVAFMHSRKTRHAALHAPPHDAHGTSGASAGMASTSRGGSPAAAGLLDLPGALLCLIWKQLGRADRKSLCCAARGVRACEGKWRVPMLAGAFVSLI
jgi:hypothetical protein